MTQHLQFRPALITLAKDILAITWALFRIIIPILIVIKVLEELGVIHLLAQWLSPLMGLVGLPGETALALLSTIATGIYGGMVIFFTADYAQTLNIAQVSVLSMLMLMMHGLPVEGSIAKRVGLTWLMTILLRVVGGFLFAMLLHAVFQAGNWLQTPNHLSIPTLPQPETLGQWVWAQLVSLWWIFVVIAVLVSALRLLRYLHIEKLIGYALSPLLRLLGINERAVNITLVGVTLGLAYGGGLLIKEADSGNLSKHDLFSAICLLSLSHSLIEDTLLVLMMGADLTTVLWARLLFTAVIIAILSRWAKTRSDAFTRRYLIK